LLTFPAAGLLAGTLPFQRLSPTLRLRLTEHTYVPKVAVPRSDWVATVALPAFLTYRARYPDTVGGGTVGMVGTGAGLDALAAIEVLAPARVVVTDVHQEVVTQAVHNIQANLRAPHTVQVEGLVGDLGEPFLARHVPCDVLYENLPNIPLPAGLDLLKSHHSAHFVHDTGEAVPPNVAEDLLGLHWRLLRQASLLLTATGHLLCAIGCRRPLAALLALPHAAGCNSQLLLYTWKIQAEALEVVQGYAAHQRRGGRPFHFYHVAALERAFGPQPLVTSTAQALALERALLPEAVDAEAALHLVESGVPLGHTVAVLEATPRRRP
jgi:methylase of polypeptide subunit release factors